MSASSLLRVENLSVAFATPRGELRALDAVTLDLPARRTLAIVGESGSGKSVLARAILRLLPATARVDPAARIQFDGRDLLRLDARAMQTLRGRRIAMVFQDPMTALNPVRTIGAQLMEGLRLNLGIGAHAAEASALRLIEQVGIALPRRRLGQYPHELSGGMRQRVVIAMAIACEPELLIADEPTTALDVTVQAQILALLAQLKAERHMTMILVTHDLGVAARHADEMAVMYAGQVVERAATRALFKAPRMPYTQALLRAIPGLGDAPHAELASIAGRPPTVIGPTAGCRFAPRCERRAARCEHEDQRLVETPADGRSVRCWRAAEVDAMAEAAA